MEMTNEEKQAFYSLYWNQRVLVFMNAGTVPTKVVVNGENIDRYSPYASSYLELRSVEQMTDDELVEVAKIQTKTTWVGISPAHGRGVFSEGFEKLTPQDVDYLRSIGVLVGFRHFTPEMLIAEGVVKIKQ